MSQRVYYRIVPDIKYPDVKRWIVVETDSAGFDDAVYVVALAQCLLLQLGESPFWADWGIPAVQSVQSQVAPDYFVALMQQRFAPRFASLIITNVSRPPSGRNQRPVPTYDVKILTHRGARVSFSVPTLDDSFVLDVTPLGGGSLV